MSLGRHSGAALIGRPLDMSVQAVLDAQDEAGNLCLEADVFYADNKLDRSRVRVTLEKSATAPQQARIRIRSTALVDEPIVTVYLRVGCLLKTERRYVSLAELASEAVPDKNIPAALPPAASIVPVRPAALPPANIANPTADAQAPPSAKTAKPARRSRADAPASLAPAEAGRVPLANEQTQAPRPKAPREAAPPNSNKAVASTRARLRLEPLDLAIERDPQLKSSAELLSIPAANPLERAAASALWRALSAQPQDILRDTEQLQALENSVRGLQAQSQKTLLSIDDLNLKLQKAQEERYANPLVYGLIALLLAALVGLIFLLRRRLSGRGGKSGDKPWWRKNETYESQQHAWEDSSPPQDVINLHGIGTGRLVPAHKSALLDQNVDFDLDHAGSRAGTAPRVSVQDSIDSIPLASRDRSDFGSSMLHAPRAVKAEELFDVQQQADFFVSIGQHEQAIEVLRSHIGENHETSALVYLDLFNLYHQLSRPAEYESLRSGFNQRFNAQIPTFELYTDKNLGLESYRHALSRIEALWPSPKVLEIIEESLFRRPDNHADSFNLEAYRELLMLYSVAKEIISPEAKTAARQFDLPATPADGADSRPMTFKSTSIQPLSASMDASQQTEHGVLVEPLRASEIPPVSRRLGLDIDLSKLSAPDARVEPVKQSDAKFFANFDAAATTALPASDASNQASASNARNPDNLIDFDIFDVPLVAPENLKPPQV